jgi:hypothetical protein
VLEQFSGKQSFPFMELFGQLCLTACATLSYCLWKCLTNSPQIYRTVLATVLEQFLGKQSSNLSGPSQRQKIPGVTCRH